MAKGAEIKWRGEAVTATVTAKAEKALDRAAIIVVNYAKNLMREPKSGVPPPRTKRRRSTRGHITTRSAPGEAPAAQHGGSGLLGSVAYSTPGELTRHIGTNKLYGLFLELGTPKMAARPWLERSLFANAAQIGALFGA